MKYTALGIGYPSHEHDAERSEWTGYGLDFDFASSVEEAKSMLQCGNYVCVAIRAHDVGPEEIFALRQVKAIPMIILPPYYSVAEAHICAHFSAIQYIRACGYGEMVIKDRDDSLKYGLQIAAKKPEALTIFMPINMPIPFRPFKDKILFFICSIFFRKQNGCAAPIPFGNDPNSFPRRTMLVCRQDSLTGFHSKIV